MIRTSQTDLMIALRTLDLPADHVYVVHCSLLKLGLIEGGLKGVMQCLWDVLGRDATILMPTFTFAFGRTRVWDYHQTRSETGALSEYFRRLPGALRTIHPFHSLAVIGPRTHQFSDCAALSSFGHGSPYALLYDVEAINIAIGIDLVCGATFVHHTEEMAQVPYRFYKEFPGEVCDQHGQKMPNTYKMYVRKITDTYEYDTVWSDVREDLAANGLVIQGKLKGAPLVAFRIKQCHDHFIARLKSDPYYSTVKRMIKPIGKTK
jgi:aminoglycoside 3-N-acetyltransferase